MSFKRRKSIDNGDYNVAGVNTSVTARKAARRTKTNPPAPAPRQKATVKQLATDELQTSVSDVDDHIVKRIQKCLERANHPNTPELEAKAALFLSSRLMSQYNVTKADLLAKETDANRGVADGLLSKERENEREEVRRKERELLELREREEELQRQREVKGQNVGADDDSRDVSSTTQVETHRSVSDDEWRHGASSPSESTVCLNEYDGFTDFSFDCYDFGSDYDDHEVKGDSISEAELEPDFKLDATETLDPTADLDEEIQRILKREESPTCPPDSINTECQQDVKAGDSPNRGMSNIIPDVRWTSEMQLTWFRETAEQVAQNVLKAKNIKLSRRTGRNAAINDFGAYFQGKEDSRKINVRQKW